MKEKNKNDFHAYWQCPNCKHANMSIASNDSLEMEKFECSFCKKKYSLIKAVTQVLCNPLTFIQNEANFL